MEMYFWMEQIDVKVFIDFPIANFFVQCSENCRMWESIITLTVSIFAYLGDLKNRCGFVEFSYS